MARKQPTWIFTLTCVGMKFRWTLDGRKQLKFSLPFPVQFVREPDNQVDENAIMVLVDGDEKLRTLKGKQLGYVRADAAALLAPRFDAGILEVVGAWVETIDVEHGQCEVMTRFRDIKKPLNKPKRTTKPKT